LSLESKEVSGLLKEAERARANNEDQVGAVAVYRNEFPFEDTSLTWWLYPGTMLSVIFSTSPEFPFMFTGSTGLVKVCLWLLTHASFMVTVEVPVLFAMTRAEPGVPVRKERLVIATCSVAMKKYVA